MLRQSGQMPPPAKASGQAVVVRQRTSYAHGNSRYAKNRAGEWLNFSSNDYLGLAADKRLVAAARQALERYGVGSGGSQFISGYHRLHAELEQRLAEFTGCDRALLFASGYQANLGTFTALLKRHDNVFPDRLVHASIIDALRLSQVALRRFAHNDMSQLQDLLTHTGRPDRATWIISEAVFSMEGDSPPFARLCDLAAGANATAVIDDAHGFGVNGPQGRGSLAAHGLGQQQVPIMVGTLGKACGVSGGFVAGRRDLIDCIEQRARSLIYSTAPAPALAAAALTALDIVATEQWRRDDLQALIDYWRQAAAARGWSLLPSASAIQPLWIGSNAAATRVSAGLQARGLLVPAIRPPTVPAGQARLRISLSAAHRRADVDQLLAALDSLL